MPGYPRRSSALGYPQAKLRLYMSIPAAAFFFFLLYEASVSLGWLNLGTGFLALVGVAEGLLVGFLEASIVTGKLARESETVAWQVLPMYLLSGVPLILIIIRYGTEAFLPYGVYLVLPYVPAYYAVSGWKYNAFEKQRKVRIFTFIYGIWFWLEDVDASHRSAEFMKSVASKDSSGILGQLSYLEKIEGIVKKDPKIRPSTRNVLFKTIEKTKRYHRRSMEISWIFVTSLLLLIVYFFVMVSTNTFGLVTVVDGQIVSGREASLILGIVPMFLAFAGPLAARLLLNRRYREGISTLLASVNPEILADLKSLSEKA